MEHSESISKRQESLIAHLLTERTIDAACKKADVSASTYWRWMKEAPFLNEYRRAREGILENTVAKLQSLTYEAIDTLERNLHCENPSVEIRCATIILEQAIKGMEMLNLKARVEELEESLRREGSEE
jgi:hypothetical protein